MINFYDVTNENIEEHDLNCRQIPNHPYWILVVGSSGSGKTDSLFNPFNNTGWEGEGYFTYPCWFSHNNLETVKAVTLRFCNIQQHFISSIHTKFFVPNLPQSSDSGQNPGSDISNF